ncbi:tetratricopeptide repeat protein [Winogradskyella wandonensis]|uniref:Tetratricopeptide repeat protein n=1 Tax=Winogradskyella wandonensis TaxID=1442586 RepID=A0A4R1KW78_9FLAO|nr:tetratricopeptide repeat protein [Winogradskyella wandonensis]TCK69455.1 tetratricopeptide repeat protein [Winogradskyella wandonensis]
MKKIITLICALVISTMSFAQKNEIKAIEKALKNNDFATAKANVQSAESLLSNMDDKMKSKFYFIKAESFYANGNASDSDLDKAIEALEILKEHEKQIGKLKYTDEANEIKSRMLESVLKKADEALQNKDYLKASKKFSRAYNLSPQDTSYLYYAASTAVSAKAYDTSLGFYVKLRDLGYTGIKMNYYATNVDTGKEEVFSTEKARDFSVQAKLHQNPRDEMSDSKASEIAKNIALIYVSQDENEKALDAIEYAKKNLKNDYNLVLAEGNIYLKLDNKEKAFELFKKALAMEPNNASLNFNVGVLSMNSGAYEDASNAFKNALRIKPDYSDAALNLSTIEINKGNALNDEMNSLGTSAADNRKYEELKKKKIDYLTEGANILENFISNNPNVKNMDILNQLKSIYSFVGDTVKFKIIKEKIEAIEAGN